MAKKEGQRLKVLRLVEILNEYTDEQHGITVPEIEEKLKSYGVPSERKSIYADIDELKDNGFNISKKKKQRKYYYTLHKGEKDFTIGELKILVDAVQASRFITLSKSKELIKKLRGFASLYQSRELDRDVHLANRAKSSRDNSFSNIDKIYEAIHSDRMLFCNYYMWSPQKRLVPRHGGKRYKLSPWGVAWADDNYYLVAYDSDLQEMRHYRIDKMDNITVSENKRREGKALFNADSFDTYSQTHFSMFSGKEIHVKLECANHLAGSIIDRLGSHVSIMKKDEDHFYADANIAGEKPFIGWVIGLGEGIKIISPKSMVDEVHKVIERLRKTYK